MLYGVIDYSTADSTLVDPIVLDYQAQQAAQQAAATQAATQAAAFPSWVLVLGAVAAGYWYWQREHKRASKSGTETAGGKESVGTGLFNL